MIIHFTKMHGLGNDFMVIDALTQTFKLKRRQIKQWADRHTGVGFDQLLLVEPPYKPESDFFFRIYNADGSEAEQCGNGARCFGRFVSENRLTWKKNMVVETAGGLLKIELLDDNQISVNMGFPEFRPAHIPFQAKETLPLYILEVGAETVEIAAISIGNPHAVLTVTDLKTALVKKWGPLIEKHSRFPKGANVGFMQIIERDRILLRVFERGVGETEACGSGACAAVITGIKQGLLDETVLVELPGGNCQVSYKGASHPVWLTGPATTVYQGKIRL